MLDALITSQTRLQILLKFFSNRYSSSYLREMVKEFGESTNSIHYEFHNLTRSGRLNSREKRQNIYYSANTGHTRYPKIKALINKYLSLGKIPDDIVHKVLSKLAGPRMSFITGDYAAGRDTDIIDLVVGSLDRSYIQKCITRVGKLIYRKVRTLVLIEYEFEAHKKHLKPDKAPVLR